MVFFYHSKSPLNHTTTTTIWGMAILFFQPPSISKSKITTYCSFGVLALDSKVVFGCFRGDSGPTDYAPALGPSQNMPAVPGLAFGQATVAGGKNVRLDQTFRSFSPCAGCFFVCFTHLSARWWFQIFFIFNPTWGNDPNLTNIFQLGWNHQPWPNLWTTGGTPKSSKSHQVLRNICGEARVFGPCCAAEWLVDFCCSKVWLP